MSVLLQQLTTDAAGRYHVISSNTSRGMEIECIDLDCRVLCTLQLYPDQLFNPALLKSAVDDFKVVLSAALKRLG